MEPESIIASITPGDEMDIQLAPVWVDGDGFPLLVTGDHAQTVFSKLEDMSRQFGTQFERSGDRLRIRVNA